MNEIEQKNVVCAQRLSVYKNIKSLYETSDINEVAQMLSTGEWIAVFATPNEPHLFSLGKITD